MADNPSIRRYQTRVRAGEDPGDAFADFLATIGNPAGRSKTIFSPQPYTTDCDPIVLAETGQCVSSTQTDVHRYQDLQTALPVTGKGGDGPGKGSAITDAPPTIAPGPPVAIPTDGLMPTPVPNLTAGDSEATNPTPPVPEIIAPVESVANKYQPNFGANGLTQAGAEAAFAKGGFDAYVRYAAGGDNPPVKTVLSPATPAPLPIAAPPRTFAARTFAPRTKAVVRPASVTRSAPGWSSTSIPCIPKEVLADYMKAFKKRKRCP